MKTLKKIIRKYLWLAIVFAIAIRIFYPGRYVSLNNGDSAHVKPALFWGALPWSDCKIVYQPKEGKEGTLIFQEGLWSCPIMLFPASDGHSFFCWYFNDINTPLLRFDPTRDYNDEAASARAKEIVRFSPWSVEEASASDWQEAQAYLAKSSSKEYESFVVSSHCHPSQASALQMLANAAESAKRFQNPDPWLHY